MDPILQRLIRYQELSLQARDLEGRLLEHPARIATIEEELSTATGALDSAKQSLDSQKKERRRLEGELQDLEAKFKKYNEQLMQVKTNDEYKAMQHEISGVKEKVGGVEEKILMLMEEIESTEGRIRLEETALEVRRKEADQQKGAARAEHQKIETEAARIGEARRAAAEELGPELLDMFNRIALGRNGVAVARARDERCQECNVRLRPQVFQEIKRNDRLIHCDSCIRILYYIAEAPAADAQA